MVRRKDVDGSIARLRVALDPSDHMFDHSIRRAQRAELIPEEFIGTHTTLRDARKDAEKRAIRMALLQTNDNISNAAKLLEVSRPKLYDLLRQYDMKP